MSSSHNIQLCFWTEQSSNLDLSWGRIVLNQEEDLLPCGDACKNFVLIRQGFNNITDAVIAFPSINKIVKMKPAWRALMQACRTHSRAHHFRAGLQLSGGSPSGSLVAVCCCYDCSLVIAGNEAILCNAEFSIPPAENTFL